MSNNSNRILDEFAKILTDAGGAARSFRDEAENVLRTQMEKMVYKLDLVKREEFEVLKDMVVKYQRENHELYKRIEDLEKSKNHQKSLISDGVIEKTNK